MKTERLIETLSHEILSTIRTNGLVPGQALPPARELASRFGVTVPSVREALRRLEATDLVELRHGSGTYVGASIHRRILDNPYYDPADRDSIAELFDARIAIEPGIAALAAQVRDDDALNRLTRGTDHALEHETEVPVGHFHVELARASGNRALCELLEALLSLYRRAHQTSRVRYDRVQDHREHCEIVDAVRRGDPFEAEHRTKRHLINLKNAALGAEENDDNPHADA
ncbi:FadR/GntR family transcriptional regulator [Nesterenkonia xinjiangensis]|uniref:DNA-binding FadR family transcriptional regulator n=1 Tax=Nesterenkonia xinjiangensis TaxID=225327 RepID=A0A7Z0GJP4_9MICC|nr:GntR family transcriptional regulator [Nesterenkonia xinjiangensis]NYJ77220.1 DNA-binding FadR family transcriptional regulator [Nesterenkonia xinjiangensis]